MPESDPPTTDHVDQRYREFRARQCALNAAILASIDRLTLDQAASLLGIRRRGEIVIRSEGARLALLEFAMFDVFRGGMNVAQRFLQRNAAPTPADAEAAESMRRARFRVAEVRTDGAGGRIQIIDWLRGEPLTLVDTNLALSLRAGDLFSVRTQPLDEAWVSNGAVFVFAGPHRAEALRRLEAGGIIARYKDRGRTHSAESETDLSTLMMRAALEFGLDRQLMQRAAS